MAKRFEAGESEYQTDHKWWELVEEAEAAVLQGASSTPSTTETLGGDEQEDAGDDVLGGSPDSVPTAETEQEEDQTSEPERIRLASLSRQYTDDLTGQRYDVVAYSVREDDPAISELQCPWAITRTTAGPWEFFVHLPASAFSSITLTPLDALLAQLAWVIADFERGQGSDWTFGAILTSLREKYAVTSKLSPQDLVSDAAAQLVDIARSIVGRISVEDALSFFDELSPSRQESIRVAMASRSVPNPHAAIGDGRFLQYAAPGIISEFVLSNPVMFFDGSYWDEAYSAIDYGSTVATDEAKARLIDHYAGLLADVVWLAQQAPADLESMGRERLMRASLATALLQPTATIGDDE
jgi:hypothetical protein